MLMDNQATPLILVVEDDENHAELIQRSFADAPEGYCLEIVRTLDDARRAMERQLPLLVLTDYRLPDGDGSELVVASEGAFPVIMMTSQGNEQIAVEVMKTGARDYIVKSAEIFSSLPRIVKHGLREWNLVLGRRKADEEVLRAKQMWDQTFDAVPDLIAIVDTRNTILRANRSMARHCGCTPDELVGRDCFSVVHGTTAPPPCCSYVETIRDGQVHTVEVEAKGLNGIFDITVSPLLDAEGRVTSCVHVARDVTERRRAETERLELEQQFQKTQKLESLGVLTGGIAHDFNNILTIILGHCFMLQAQVGDNDPHATHVEQIETAANRAADLCRQMLTYAGQSPLLQTQVNMRYLVKEIVKMLSSAIKKNVAIKLDIQRDLPVITGDTSQIQQVVMNLIINAAEAIGDANGTINVALAQNMVQVGHADTDFLGQAIRAGGYVCLDVADTGCGMDEETQARIFEPFYTTKFAGRGLGMSAILGIIRSHGGALQLSSTQGVGTSFRVWFPLPAQPLAVETVPIAEPVVSWKGSATILLVDDEGALRTIGSALLAAMGCTVLTAANGREALAIHHERGSGIDLVLLDLLMPEMGGVETYRELRKKAPSLPIIICSGYTVDDVSEEICHDEQAGFLRKPYQPDELRSVLHTYLGNGA